MQRFATLWQRLTAAALCLTFLTACPGTPPPGASKPLGIRGYIAVATQPKEFDVALPEQIYVPRGDRHRA